MKFSKFFVLCLVFISLASFFATLSLIHANTVVWEKDFIWLVSQDNISYTNIQKVLDAFRFTYNKLNVANQEITLSDFVSGGAKKYSGIILQDGGDVGNYLGASEIQVIRDVVTTFGINLIVILPDKTEIKSLLGVQATATNPINPYDQNYRVDFATNALLLSFSGSLGERELSYVYLYNFTISDAAILATYNDTKTTHRPIFSVKVQPSGSYCFAIGTEYASLDERVGISRFVSAILLGIALRDSVPSDRFIRPGYASIIVDDYCLQDITFQENLLSTLVSKNARAAFGFIPARYQQTSPAAVTHFKANSAYWEIILHGNDHSSNELTTDYDTSIATLQQSIQRMDSLKEYSGVGYEMIEVFPNEQYIVEDFKALRDESFLTSMSYYRYNGWDLKGACSLFDFSNYDYPSMGRGGLSFFNQDTRGWIRGMDLFHAPIVFYFHPGSLGGWLNDTVDFINGLGVTWKKPSEIVSSAYDAKYDPTVDAMQVVVSKVRYPSLVIGSTKYYYDLANSGSTNLLAVSSSYNPLLESLTGVFQPAFNLTGWNYADGRLNFQILSKVGAIATTSIYCGERRQPASVKVNGVLQSSSYNEATNLVTFNVAASQTANTVEIVWGQTLDTSPPTYSDLGYSSIIAGSQSVFSSRWQDNRGLSGYIFSSNNTGVWLNNTWTTLTGNPATATVTLTLNNNAGLNIGYRWYCNDTSNNWRDTGVLAFTSIKADTQAPKYSQISANSTIASTTSKFSSYWTDNNALNSFIFSSNITGTWANDTLVTLNGVGSWANVTKALPNQGGVAIGYRWYCVDSYENWNDTGVQTLTTTYSAKPQFSNLGYTSTEVNQPTKLSVLWTDDQQLSGYIFGTNVTGIWVNDTWSALSQMQGWANKTVTLPASVGVRVEFQWWCNDSQGQWNMTGLRYLITTPKPVATSVFGKTSIGATTTTVPASYVVASRFQAPQSGSAVTISSYIRGKYATGSAKVLIYSDNNGAASDLLYTSAEIPLQSNWAWHNFTANFNLQAGTYYWFAVYTSVESQLQYDAGSTNQLAVAWGWTYPTVPSRFNGVYGPSYGSVVASTYITYIPA